MRLNQYLSKAGAASRRKSDVLISEGRVKVNGELVQEFGFQVDDKTDFVTLDDFPVKVISENRYYILNKPSGTISAVSDDRGRVTIIDMIKNPEGLHPVGRLDYNTTGVIFITNDGELTNNLTHPSRGIERVYEARLSRKFEKKDVKIIRKGVRLEDGVAKVQNLISTGGKNVTLTLTEGKNREVKRIFEAMGYRVKRLHRSSFAGLSDRGLKIGQYRDLTKKELKSVREKIKWT